MPSYHIREYRHAYGRVKATTGENFFLILPYCNIDCMVVFLQDLSKQYKDNIIVVICDGVKYHKSKVL